MRTCSQVLKSLDCKKVTVDVVEVAVHSDAEHDAITLYHGKAGVEASSDCHAALTRCTNRWRCKTTWYWLLVQSM